MARLKTGRHTSAIKAARQSRKKRWANRSAKDGAKDLTKQLLAAAARKDQAASGELLKKTEALLAKLGRRHVIHPTAASRKVSRLSRAVRRLLSAS
ncbi:MAG: 30S ribosomal protein S20 [Elusimicrobiota bacterium]|jgi:small subunit ribosomal protein S20